jgi:hypothetical protein
MKTKFLVATLFLFLGLASVSLSGCSFGGHVSTSTKSSLIE